MEAWAQNNMALLIINHLKLHHGEAGGRAHGSPSPPLNPNFAILEALAAPPLITLPGAVCDGGKMGGYPPPSAKDKQQKVALQATDLKP